MRSTIYRKSWASWFHDDVEFKRRAADMHPVGFSRMYYELTRKEDSDDHNAHGPRTG